MAKVIAIELKADKNGVQQKITQFDGGQKVWISAKYNADIYESITEGSEHELHKEGDWWKMGAAGANSAPSGGYQSKRAGEIRVAQDHKEESIAWFNATNAAISLCGQIPQDKGGGEYRDEVKEVIRYWREWFLKEWENHKDPTNQDAF